MMNEHNQPVELDLDEELIGKTRKELRPWWVTAVSWFFLFPLLALATVLTVVMLVEITVNGFVPVETIDYFSLFVVVTYLYKSYVAYCLLFEKAYAILLAEIDAYFSIIWIIINMVINGVTAGSVGNAVFGILIQVVFLTWLHKIHDEWAAARPGTK